MIQVVITSVNNKRKQTFASDLGAYTRGTWWASFCVDFFCWNCNWFLLFRIRPVVSGINPWSCQVNWNSRILGENLISKWGDWWRNFQLASLICFICIVLIHGVFWAVYLVQFVAISAFVCALVILIMYLFNLVQLVSVNWNRNVGLSRAAQQYCVISGHHMHIKLKSLKLKPCTYCLNA